MKKMLLLFVFLLFLPVFALAKIEVALTIDDLPYVGPNNSETLLAREDRMFRMFLDKLNEARLPATGFVIVDSIGNGQWQLIEMFKQAGYGIGSHNYTHTGASRVSAEQYIQYITEADQALKPYFTEPKYFRFPYLDGGSGEKRKTIRDYLTSHGYTIAPVTMDTHDFNWNARYSNAWAHHNKAEANAVISGYLHSIGNTVRASQAQALKKYGRQIKYILLIHLNTINARCFDRVINELRKNGVTFITLPEAMQDPVYHSSSQEM